MAAAPKQAQAVPCAVVASPLQNQPAANGSTEIPPSVVETPWSYLSEVDGQHHYQT